MVIWKRFKEWRHFEPTLLLFVLLAVVLFAISQSPRPELNSTQQYVASDGHNGRLTSPAAAGESPQSTGENAECCERAEKLFYQEWDFWVAVATLLLFIATVGLAVPAWRAVLDARKHAELELRAYVGIKEIVAEINGVEGGLRGLVSVMFDNFGQTPAYNLRTYGYVEFLPWTQIDFRKPDEVDPFASRASMAPTAGRTRKTEVKQRFVWPQITPTQDKPSESAIYAWGVIVYEDAFGKTHRTHYKAYLGGNSDPQDTQEFTGIMGGSSRYRMRTYWDGNDAD